MESWTERGNNMRGMRITTISIEEIKLETMEMRLNIKARTNGIKELKIYAKDPHKHRTDGEIYTWDDEVKKIDNTEQIYIVPEKIRDE